MFVEAYVGLGMVGAQIKTRGFCNCQDPSSQLELSVVMNGASPNGLRIALYPTNHVPSSNAKSCLHSEPIQLLIVPNEIPSVTSLSPQK